MQQKRLKQALKDKSGFVVIVELTCGLNFNFGPIDEFLRGYRDSGPSSVPDGFDFVGITSTDNSGGTPNIETIDILSHIRSEGLLGGLDFIPHISCKDLNIDAMVSSLVGFKAADIESMLVITGDKPVKGKKVFELEAVGFLQMIKEMNSAAYLNARIEELEDVHQFWAGAAVSPFKYTEPSQMQQYYKMEKKTSCGAEFMITQVGWDWKKSLELFRYLEERGLEVPIIGNVFLLSNLNPAPRLMHDLKLPGCFVSDELLAGVTGESLDENIARAAQQVAMYKSMGAAGVDIGSVHDYRMFIRILEQAAEIGDNWERFKDNLYWPKEGGFYLYDDNGSRVKLSKPKKTLSQRNFNLVHALLMDPERPGFRIFRRVMRFLGAAKGEGFVYKAFDAIEKSAKYILFDCEACGDCFLTENFGLCTMGGCEKGLDNVPCGDATVDGYCGNDLERICVGELVYNAAAAQKGGIDRWLATICPPRDHQLENTSSMLNYLFGRDHTKTNPLLTIGELIWSSVPKTGGIIKQLHALGGDAYSKESGPLNYVKAMIESQAAAGADYIAVNLDAFAENEPQITIELMTEYVRLVRNWGNGMPVCIDSDNKDVLTAGLKEWYNTDQTVKPPLLASIKPENSAETLALKKRYDYAVVTFLTNKDETSGQSAAESIEQLYSSAKQTFETLVGKYDFKSKEVFFELSTCPLAAELSEDKTGPGHTYIVFEAIKKIMQDTKMRGVHCLVRPGTVGRKLPRSLGISRAYVTKAMEYGLDAAFVNPAKRFGLLEPAGELLELVDAYAKMDASAKSREKAVMLTDKFRR